MVVTVPDFITPQPAILTNAGRLHEVGSIAARCLVHLDHGVRLIGQTGPPGFQLNDRHQQRLTAIVHGAFGHPDNQAQWAFETWLPNLGLIVPFTSQVF